MSQINSKKKLQQNVLPLLSYKQIFSLLILLLVTSSSTQTPSTPYVCPTDCECNLDNFSAKCENLESLIASYSRKHASKKFMPIKSLDLSNNELTKISNQLEVLVNLTELNLSHNKLSQVRKLNFQYLESLDLSHNHITSGKLSKLPKNIVNLNLAYNDITYLPVDFMKLKKLRTLDLHENPLNCTCDTLHVRNWMSYQNVWSSKVIKCTSPQIVKGQPWLQARQNDICLEATTTRPIKKTWDDIDDNDVMLGDQPQMEDNEGDDNKKPDYEYDDGQDIFDNAMLNDEPKDDDQYNDYDEKIEKDELADDFLVVKSDNKAETTAAPESSVEKTQANYDDMVEGSGEPMLLPVMEHVHEEKPDELTKTDEDEDEGSGEGSGFIPIFIPDRESTSESTQSEPTTENSSSSDSQEKPDVVKTSDEDYDTEDDKVTTEASLVPIHVPDESAKPDDKSEEDENETTDASIISGTSTKKHDLKLGIFEDNTEPPIILGKGQSGKIDEEPPKEPEAEVVPDVTESGENKQQIKSATTEDNTGTYILLAIIGILLISLIIFVAMKNRQEKRQARNRYDVEKNGATELQDMDKRQGLLGKPIEKNGNGKHAEHSPLIDYPDHKDNRPELTSFKPPQITVDEPVQELPHKEKEKSQQSLYDMPNGNGNVHEPIEAVHASPNNGSVPRTLDSDDDVFHPASDTPIDPESLNVSPEPPKRYSPVYPPVSPRSARYSPVYSPETGRVKIKLTETPKPKTPVVVTRSRSRAGDYVNTPNN
ncbi:unnamed protein product [Chironomus riparius]|uniref:Uncharacterized protein n=1 Tax=Chironomus riparius TaxID=315576 RepID=A0A9N9WR08_9DIPT|nr:unnamed protein product [Chironomus riparius]